MGLSRRIPSTFDFSQLEGKTVHTALIHWEAVVEWQGEEELVWAKYLHCKKPEDKLRYDETHYSECVYHLWPLALRMSQHANHICTPGPGRERIMMPSFSFAPYGVVEDSHGGKLVEQLPKAKLKPGLFMIMPVSHLEAVRYLPMSSNAQDSGLPVVVTEE